MNQATGWGSYVQGGQKTEQIEAIGAELSKTLHCPCHFPAWNKNVFECKCGVLFPMFAVENAYENKYWDDILEHHKNGFKPIEM